MLSLGMKKATWILVCLAVFGLAAFKSGSSTEIRAGFKKFYDEHQVDGSFILYDQKNDKYIIYNQSQIHTPFTPASTFKIYNSLIALESGVVKDQNVTFKWDGTKRRIPEWNSDTDMKNAFKNSTVWYYQELAKRTGGKKMKYWLDQIQYGNADTTGGIDGFWLWGGLRITPNDQIDLLRKLHNDKLPFSTKTLNIVKDIMIVQDTAEYVVRGKTGTGRQGAQSIGWYVGYVTTPDNVYYFANCIQATGANPRFKNARINIADSILKALKVIR